jgi:GT2 family glycosyltransferase
LPNIADNFASCYIAEDKVEPDFLDSCYQTKSARLADAGYRLWTRGVLLQSRREEIVQLQQLPKPTLVDEYTFIRKYWGEAWAAFALLTRIFTLKNIFKETSAFFTTTKIKRINPYSDPFKLNSYTAFQSLLIQSSPLVTVIIPTLNRYTYLKDVLQDLEKQSYQNFDVLVFDQSEDFDEIFYRQFSLNLKVHKQKGKLLWTARNNAVKATKAEFLLFFDDDSRVDCNWIFEHLKCMDFFNADISAGVSMAKIGRKIPESYNYFRWADQFDSGNAMVKRNVFKSIGLFDEQFNGMRMGDGEFSYRAYINGFKSISNPNASRIHLKVSSGGLREMGSWDGFRPTKWFAPKPVPSVLYLYKKYLPPALCRNAVLIGIMLSNVSYKHKRSSKMLMVSVLLTVIKSPLLLIQYYRSLAIAKQMLNNNYQAEILNEQ